MMRPLSFVVAMGENRVIGRDNRLIWRIKSDLKFFRQNTIGRPVIMGRKTFLSIGKPLPGRENIVLSRETGFAPEGVHVASSIDEALRLGEELADKMGADEIAVAGGADVYAQLMPFVSKIVLTRVKAAPEGDAFFPAFDEGQFTVSFHEEHVAGPEDDHDFAFIIHERIMA